MFNTTTVLDFFSTFVSKQAWFFWIKSSRPRFWMYTAGPVLLSLTWLIRVGLLEITQLPWSVGVVLCYYLFPGNLFLYGVNDLADQDTDSFNDKKDSYESRVTQKNKWLMVYGVGWSALWGVVLLALLTPKASLAHLFFLLLCAAYSLPPLRFKVIPFLDSYSNVLYAVPALVGLWQCAPEVTPSWQIVVGAWCWTAAMHAFSAIPDQTADSKANLRTIATTLGTSGTLLFCLFNWAVCAVLLGLISLGAWAGIVLSVYPVLCGALLLGIHKRGNAEKIVARAYQWFPYITTIAGAVLTVIIVLS
jgi:lycopene elongase/hydratase (dihydrobisanhydrobacterioruberin-forming)